MRISDWIDAFQPAEGPPPQELGAFLRWSLSGAWPVLALAAFISAMAGTMEVGTALILGLVIDSAVSSGPEGFFDGSNTVMIATATVFFLMARPILFGWEWAKLGGFKLRW